MLILDEWKCKQIPCVRSSCYRRKVLTITNMQRSWENSEACCRETETFGLNTERQFSLLATLLLKATS
ncbi:hypothetical protein LINPERPRIM_LOCUS1193 [Linum perenne]